ncbi:RNA polymerase sigma factor SigF [Synechococcus sp. PCC 7336]|uniref:RNA polymerase sigma factor SigF n=1 Tax=Synechococcus sp. PCC 7336 TaxID=195250 RepID=UPI0003492B09|nr:RNA polymerase sigma factor SigF [Synechococcus sp. PCC 7336]
MVNAPANLVSGAPGQVSSLPKRKARGRVSSRDSELKAKTIELLQQYNKTRSATVRNRLVEMNLGLVRKEAHHWKHQCQENYDDLMQIGCIGLIQAIERFDLSRGLAFSSFAMPYIRGEIQHYLRDKSPTVRIPRRWSALLHRSKKVVAQLRQELGRSPFESEVREAMELTPDEWQQFQVAKQNQSTLSLDAPVRQSDSEGSSLGDIVPDARYQSFQLAQEDQLRLRQAMSQLEERTCKILEFVFLYDLTQKETAVRLNISAVTVSRQVKKGLSQLAQLLGQDEDAS